eukprot:INCI16226.1.p1 GENE.INCI16226.1~~INCI16226.1.p1  ORF type:complete len:357 (+),score=66.21 INCI16226.1:215-1285(+)
MAETTAQVSEAAGHAEKVPEATVPTGRAGPERTIFIEAPSEEAVGLRIVCVSDTHDFQKGMPQPIPRADVLVHAGDFTCRGTRAEVASFVEWMKDLLREQVVKHVVCIAGNHELGLEPGRAKHPAVVRAHEAMRQSLHEIPNMYFLEDSGCSIRGLTFYGSPWTLPISGKPCGDWAFQLKDRPDAIGSKFAAIPEEVDILVTHMMPFGKLDELCEHNENKSTEESTAQELQEQHSQQPQQNSNHKEEGLSQALPQKGDLAESVEGAGKKSHSHDTEATNTKKRWKRIGSMELMRRVQDVAPLVHVFGHFHAGHGIVLPADGLRTTFVNAAICNEDYRPDQQPFVIQFTAPEKTATL